MRIAIIGAGFTGLAASLYLQRKGHKTVIFEKDSIPGGLAMGFKEDAWQWSLEKHYHHFFTNDSAVLNLARDIGQEIIIKRPKTSAYINGEIYQLDSPIKALTFPKLSFLERLRMGFVLGLLRYSPVWKPFEKIKAVEFLSKAMGQKAYKMIWEPQLFGKFSKYTDEISLAWFWARIKKRTTKLAYPKGGFLNFANEIDHKIKEEGGEILYNTEIIEIESKKNVSVKVKDNKGNIIEEKFDKVIVTLPSFLFLKITKNLPAEYVNNLKKLKGLGATNLVLRLKKQFFKGGTYWLSVCNSASPILAIVEHTNFMDKSNYNNEHLLYLGKYLDLDHPYFKKSAKELLKIYDPYLKAINKDYKKNIIDFHLFKTPFAQPIISLNYSKVLPPFQTPLPNVFLANIQQVYPWDRGTNYAVELGEKVAKLIEKEL